VPPAPGDRWFVDEPYLKVAGTWTQLYRAADQSSWDKREMSRRGALDDPSGHSARLVSQWDAACCRNVVRILSNRFLLDGTRAALLRVLWRSLERAIEYPWRCHALRRQCDGDNV